MFTTVVEKDFRRICAKSTPLDGADMLIRFGWIPNPVLKILHGYNVDVSVIDVEITLLQVMTVP